MMCTNDKLEMLRKEMAENGVDGFLIPSTDPHMSEYVPDHWTARAYFSGFSGSAGTLVVTQKASALWTDGRYFIQAENQLSESEIVLQKMGIATTPSVEKWIEEELPADSVMGFDGMVVSEGAVRRLKKALFAKKIELKNISLITEDIWPDRPERPCSTAWLLSSEYAGKTATEKLEIVRKKLLNSGAEGTLITRLDSVAWLLNIRGDDVENTPYTLAYAYIDQERADLYLGKEALSDEVKAALSSEGVFCHDYDTIESDMEGSLVKGKVLLDPESVNFTLYDALRENPRVTIIEGADPIIALKAVKNEIEEISTIQAHIRDGVAMVRFQRNMEQKLASGEVLTEWDISKMIHAERAKQDKFISNSFTSIAAYGANAAMMHYSPQPKNSVTIGDHGFLLLDSGGQYEDGTTDITRTYVVGTLDYFSRRYYTLVLLCHIRLAKAIFMYGCTGGNVDILARETVWKEGLDYRCGTGHGVSFVGNVHEAPQSLRISNTTVLEPNMNITIEPGIYEEGVLGIRIENEYFIKEKFETEYGKFLGFENFTFCPIDTAAILPGMMGDEEIQWMNDYHKTVFEKLSPFLNDEEKIWLAQKCEPVVKENA